MMVAGANVRIAVEHPGERALRRKGEGSAAAGLGKIREARGRRVALDDVGAAAER